MIKVAKKIVIEGIVQGVGFRPFVYAIAKKYNVFGLVRNTKKGVEIEALADRKGLMSFIESLHCDKPPLALIKNITVTDLENKEFIDFTIATSNDSEEKSPFLLPDIAICNDCISDFFDDKGRYHLYPFVNCTNCGPRFSIIKDYPYDRVNTTMERFTMCEACASEYKDITSRRYHGEPISCIKCGPNYELFDINLEKVETTDLFETVRYLLKIGKIIAVKGVGGFHLVCDGKNKEAIKTLRQRKIRDTKPFAVIFKDLNKLSDYCQCSEDERKLLTSKERPIVLLKQKNGALDLELTRLIAGSSPYLGAMLPYAPYQFLLLEDFDMLIFTSGNISGEPIVYRDSDVKRLSNIADYFLIHNREIVRFVEDSVAAVLHCENKGINLLIRKSRGYAPLPLFLREASKKKILAFGGDLKATISFIKDDVLVQSQYLGDLADYLVFESYKKTLEEFKNFFDFNPELFLCDLHPAYLSHQYAKEVAAGKNLIEVQHHIAHIASVALEKGWYDDTIIGVALDGTGYGLDGNIWGSEIFLGSLKGGFKREGHLSYVPFPFGDKAVLFPEKSAFSYLSHGELLDKDILSYFSEVTKENCQNLYDFVKKSKIFTSSTGRLFDAVSFLLGFRRKIGYEGEAAIELENLVYQRYQLTDEEESYSVAISKDNDVLLICTSDIMKGVVYDLKKGVHPSTIALKFHNTLINAFVNVVLMVAQKGCTKKIALSGGTFQNSYLLYHITKKLEKEGFEWGINEFTPPNDASISVGQCALGMFL